MHSFDMQPHERTGEMRLSHGCLSRTQSNLDYWSWTLVWLFFRNWIMDMQIMFWQIHRQWWIQGRGLEGPGPPIFRNKLRPKVIFGGTAPDGSGTGRNVHIYLAVWIFLGYYHFKLKQDFLFSHMNSLFAKQCTHNYPIVFALIVYLFTW